jgi:DNA polymerase III delta subunit
VQTWKLTAALGERNYPLAVALLDRLLEAGETAGTLLSYVNRSLLSLVQATHLKQELGNLADVGAAMSPKKSDWQVKQTLKEAASWSQAELAATFDRLTRADLRIKTGEDPRLVLQLLFLQMCSRRGRG